MSETRADELCDKCGYTYAGHISNTGCLYPCWTPSGRFKPAAAAPVSEAAPTPETCGGRCYGEDGRQPLSRRCVLDKGHAGECDNRVPTTPLAPAGEPTAEDDLPLTMAVAYRQPECLCEKGYLCRWCKAIAVVAELRARVASLTTERDAATAELNEIDAAFGNVLALDRNWTRAEKIAHMLRVLRAVNAPANPSPESPV